MSVSDKPILLPDKYRDLQLVFEALQNEILKPIEDEAPKRADFSAANYTITNDTESRTFDADTVTLAQLADIVATLIKDLR